MASGSVFSKNRVAVCFSCQLCNPYLLLLGESGSLVMLLTERQWAVCMQPMSVGSLLLVAAGTSSCAVWSLLKRWSQDTGCPVLEAEPPKRLHSDIFYQPKVTESTGCSGFTLSWSDTSPVSRDGKRWLKAQKGKSQPKILFKGEANLQCDRKLQE